MVTHPTEEREVELVLLRRIDKEEIQEAVVALSQICNIALQVCTRDRLPTAAPFWVNFGIVKIHNPIGFSGTGTCTRRFAWLINFY